MFTINGNYVLMGMMGRFWLMGILRTGLGLLEFTLWEAEEVAVWERVMGRWLVGSRTMGTEVGVGGVSLGRLTGMGGKGRGGWGSRGARVGRV